MDQSQPVISESIEELDKTRVTSNSSSPGHSGEKKCTVGSIVAERYEVLGELGTGGMSTVYKVRHVHLDKIFAIKILHDASTEAVQRFQIEGKASTLLDHRNIVKVHDFGVHDGHPYMILDYIEGQSLAQLIDIFGALEPRRALRIFAQICSALAHAHEQGVIHRDIKPNNIVIQNMAEGIEHVVVLDFGIAKLTNQDKVGQSLTKTGDIFGTPLYMSPEQCQGSPVSTSADIYSLGCVIYETLTGNPPFLGSNAYETIHKQITEAPPPFPIHLRKTPLGRQLEPIVLKSLAKLPQNRHKFMLQLSSELKQVEMGAGSAWGDVMSSWRLMAGRMNAVERGRVLLRTSLQACSLFSVIITLMIFLLPVAYKTTEREYLRNAAVIEAVQCIVQERLMANHISFSELELEESMRMVRQFCVGDEEEWRLAQQLESSASKARMVSRSIGETVQTLIFTPDGPDRMKDILSKIVQKWAKASSTSSQLISLAYSRKTKAMEQMHYYSFLFDAARSTGLVVDAALAMLLFRSLFLSRRKQTTPDGIDLKDVGPKHTI